MNAPTLESVDPSVDANKVSENYLGDNVEIDLDNEVKNNDLNMVTKLRLVMKEIVKIMIVTNQVKVF